MLSKKIMIIFIVLIGLAFSLTLFLNSSTLNQRIRLGLTPSFQPIASETDLVSAVERLIKGQNEVTVEITEEDVCYWIRPTFNETGYYLEILEYDTEFGECVGVIRSKNLIPLSEKMVMHSPGCVCNGQYILERRPRGLKITEW